MNEGALLSMKYVQFTCTYLSRQSKYLEKNKSNAKYLPLSIAFPRFFFFFLFCFLFSFLNATVGFAFKVMQARTLVNMPGSQTRHFGNGTKRGGLENSGESLTAAQGLVFFSWALSCGDLLNLFIYLFILCSQLKS